MKQDEESWNKTSKQKWKCYVLCTSDFFLNSIMYNAHKIYTGYLLVYS